MDKDRPRNPYDWQSDRPVHEVPRETLLRDVIDQIRKGTTGYLVGCRGMGKSAFLNQLEQRLPRDELDVLVFSAPPSDRTIPQAIQAIAYEMELSISKRGGPSEVIDKIRDHAKNQRLPYLFKVYLEAIPPEIERIVLLYDELDAYADPPELGRYFFAGLEDVRKKSSGRIVIFATGGLGLVALDTVLGSSFFSRLKPEILEPFGADDLLRLAAPFAQRGAALSANVMEALRLATGGNPALATFGLQRLWTIESPTPADVTEIFRCFRRDHAIGFLDKIKDPIFESKLSDAPERLWHKLRSSHGSMTREERDKVLTEARGGTRFKNSQWIFRMLRSTGLIRATDDDHDLDTIEVEIIPSILTLDLPEVRHSEPSLREQLVADVCDVLKMIQRMSPDFFHSENKGEKEILPESAFAVGLVLGLEPRGWGVDREAQSGAGRTDIKARHDRFGEKWALIEVKLWGRNDYKEIHTQVTSYWSDGVEVLATVMVSDVQYPTWPEEFVKKCLEGRVTSYQRMPPPDAIAGHFLASTTGCPVQEVDHFLLRLAKRR